MERKEFDRKCAAFLNDAMRESGFCIYSIKAVTDEPDGMHEDGIAIRDNDGELIAWVGTRELYDSVQSGFMNDELLKLSIQALSKQIVHDQGLGDLDAHNYLAVKDMLAIQVREPEFFPKDIPTMMIRDTGLAIGLLILKQVRHECYAGYIKKDALKAWSGQAWEEEIFWNAIQNTRNLLPIAPPILPEAEGIEAPIENLALVLTTEKELFGSTALLYPDVLQEMAGKLHGGFLILPGSLHKVLLVADVMANISADRMQNILHTLLMDVPESEKWTRNGFHYDPDTQTLETIPMWQKRIGRI